MPTQLNVIALVSGGKDSFYSILHCLQNGHKVIALANLYPPPQTSMAEIKPDNSGEGDDLNSFLYQTVGHSIIPLYADALELPVYRHQISGSAIQTGPYYDSSPAKRPFDETEDLVPLLKKVLKDYPKANAVCSGAIFSTYQRTRFESVAVRLGLTPLAYLWQYPALPPPIGLRSDTLTSLLDDMKAAGCDSRIIKIASGGMQESLLWSNVADSRTSSRIVSGMAPFFQDHELSLRGAVLGEGGEYETLATDGPRRVWKRRIEVDEGENVATNEEGGVTLLRLGRVKLVEKEEEIMSNIETDLVRVPGMFDPQFSNLISKQASGNSEDSKQEPQTATLLSIESSKETDPSRASGYVHIDANTLNASAPVPLREPPPKAVLPPWKSLVNFAQDSSTLVVSNLTSPECSEGAASQTAEIIELLQRIIQAISREYNIIPALSSSDIIFTTVLLASMSDFPSINAEYSQLFIPGTPNPPARVTVACGPWFPTCDYSLTRKDIARVSLSVIVKVSHIPPHQPPFRALHVQSRSHWAPANIGPYSQAICIPVDHRGEHERAEFVHLAGQIPLVPSTMELHQGTFLEQATLGLQHLWRVGQERGVDCWTWGVAFLTRYPGTRGLERATMAAGVWQEAHWTTAQGKPIVGDTSLDEERAEDDDDEQESGPDAWDLKYNRSGLGRVIPTVGEHLHVLPNRNVVVDPTKMPWVPPVIVAEVEELPRSAPVEWHSFGLGNLAKHPASKPRVAVVEKIYGWGRFSMCSLLPGKDADEGVKEGDSQREYVTHHFATLEVFKDAGSAAKDIEKAYLKVIEANIKQSAYVEEEENLSIVHGTAYLTPTVKRYTFAAITMVPSRRLWGCCENWGRDDEAAAMVVPRELSLAVTLRVDSFSDAVGNYLLRGGSRG